MTFEADRGAGLPTACPFVAFADERDLRAVRPDHRHRCYAEPRPASRALAHQTRFCLSPGFTSCPTFQDWANREAAHVADEAVPTMAATSGFFDEAEAALGGETGSRRGLDGSEGDLVAAGADGPVVPGSDEVAGQGHEAFAEASALAAPARVPDWDRPRPRRDYPRLDRSRRIPPVLAGLIVLVVAALAVFLLPSIITGMFGSNSSLPSPSASPTLGATATPGAPTLTPAPTPLVYVVRSGDTMSKIAKQFDVGLDELIAANPQLSDPNRINVGDQLTIPTPAPSPGASPSGTAAP